MKNLRKCILMIASCLFFVAILEAQQIVTGQITDATDGTPIQGCHVFIANTTVGKTSDANGNYSITVKGNGSFEIVVSHVGFEPYVHKIDTPQSFHQHDVALKIRVLQEVVITARKSYSQRDIDLFWSKVLGEKPSKNGIEVLNPEKVYYFLNSDKVLKASCQEPIEIINHQMGYRISYVLHSFEHDYQNGASTFFGTPHFEELISQDTQQNNRWEKKRQEVYDVSITRFLRSLYKEKIEEDGFLISNAYSLKQRQKVPLKDILQHEQDLALVSIENPLLLMCYAKPITNRIIQNSFRDLIAGMPIVMELLPQQIIIYSDGTYSGVLQIREIQGYIFGLSAMLPVEFSGL